MAMTFPDTQRAAGTGTGFLTARSYSAQDALPVAGVHLTVTGEDGARTYEPRSEAEIDKIAALVRSAIGFDSERGDTLEVVNMEFGSLIPALISGKVDMIAACITITDERAQKVLFSEPYYTGGIAALVRETKP